MEKQGVMGNEALMEVECQVCYENFTPTTTGNRAPILLDNCGHTFCKNCILAMKQEKPDL